MAHLMIEEMRPFTRRAVAVLVCQIGTIRPSRSAVVTSLHAVDGGRCTNPEAGGKRMPEVATVTAAEQQWRLAQKATRVAEHLAKHDDDAALVDARTGGPLRRTRTAWPAEEGVEASELHHRAARSASTTGVKDARGRISPDWRAPLAG